MGNVVDISKSAQKTAKKLSPEAKKDFDKAIEALKSVDTRGLNERLRATKKVQWVVGH